MSICVTGTLERYKRDEIKELIIKNGGKFASSVSSKTAFLLSGAGEENGKKTQTAQKLNIPILSEMDFFERYPQFQELPPESENSDLTAD